MRRVINVRIFTRTDEGRGGEFVTTNEVIDLLNHARVLELVAITQYMNHYYRVKGSTYEEAQEIFKSAAMMEMKHAEVLAERINLLGGDPLSDLNKVMQHYGKALSFPDDVNEMMKVDLSLEHTAINEYTSAIAKVANTDPVTRRLFEEILEVEEGHADSFASYLGEKAAFELQEFKKYQAAA
ncbi:MAG: ferritin-like domain-containing protein [Actinobacteria bacterium]|nr:ferritin-like domain-containing protein [Actinomycetota bacterium]